jgi:hypothetical protein
MTTDLDATRERIQHHAIRRRKAQAVVDKTSAELAAYARAYVYPNGPISAADFARLADVPRSTVKRWVESG